MEIAVPVRRELEQSRLSLQNAMKALESSNATINAQSEELARRNKQQEVMYLVLVVPSL